MPSTSSGSGSSSAGSGGRSTSGNRTTKPSSPHMTSTSMPVWLRMCGGRGHRPWRVDAAAERRQQADAPVAELVEASLDDQRAVVRNGAGGGLIVEIAQRVLGGSRDRDRADAPGDRSPRSRGRRAQLANELADRDPELDRPAGLVAVPERHLAWLARRGRDEHAIVRDLLDAPRRGAERERLADLRSRRPSLRRARRRASGRSAPARKTPYSPRSGIVPALAIATRLAPVASGDRALHAIPRDARTELGELVGGIAAGQHVEHAFEHAAAQLGERRGPPHASEELVDAPRFHRRHRDDLLGEDVERIARIARGFDLPLVHRSRDRRAGDEVAAELRKDDALADRARLVAGAPDALQAARDRRRRLDLHDEIDGAHVDAELERRGGDQRADARRP